PPRVHYLMNPSPTSSIQYQDQSSSPLEMLFYRIDEPHSITLYFLMQGILYSFHYVYQELYQDLTSSKQRYRLRQDGDLFQLAYVQFHFSHLLTSHGLKSPFQIH